MRRFKPFTPNYEKKAKRVDYWYSMMSELAYINWLTVDLKEKYGRMDATMFRGDEHHLVTETMEDYEAMSEERCMYCNRHCKQHRTHEDSWIIHLCLPCLIGDKITILLEKIIRWWEEIEGPHKWLWLALWMEVLMVWLWLYVEIYILSVS